MQLFMHRNVRGLVILAALCIAIYVVLGHQAYNGPIIRTLPLGYTLLSAIVVDEQTHRAFVTTDEGKLIMVDTTTARLLRPISLPPPRGTRGMPTVAGGAGHVFVAADYEQTVRMLDDRSGQLLRLIPVPGGTTALAVDKATARVYLGSAHASNCPVGRCTARGGTVQILDARTAMLLRTLRVPGPGGTTLAVDRRAHRLLVLRAVSATGPMTVSVIDITSGRIVRTVTYPAQGWMSQPLVDEATGRAFVDVGTSTGTIPRPGSLASYSVDVLDTRTGALVRSIPTGNSTADMAIAARTGHVFVTIFGPLPVGARLGTGRTLLLPSPVRIGSLQVLDARSGRIQRTIPIGWSTQGVAVDEQRGLVFVASAGSFDTSSGEYTHAGSLSVVEARSGKIRQTVSVGVDPRYVAIDRHANRLFVINVGTAGGFGWGHAPNPWEWMPAGLRQLLPFVPRQTPRPQRIPSSVSVIDLTKL
jgi:DNA-binding beta-propeller fold protein YncE